MEKTSLDPDEFIKLLKERHELKEEIDKFDRALEAQIPLAKRERRSTAVPPSIIDQCTLYTFKRLVKSIRDELKSRESR